MKIKINNYFYIKKRGKDWKKQSHKNYLLNIWFF